VTPQLVEVERHDFGFSAGAIYVRNILALTIKRPHYWPDPLGRENA
jgi:hypothetical protein